MYISKLFNDFNFYYNLITSQLNQPYTHNLNLTQILVSMRFFIFANYIFFNFL